MKIDVAIQSYKKPELLIYCLLTLHRQSKNHVDVVWINDDCSGEEVLAAYKKLADSEALSPWKINIRQNTQRMGWWVSFVRGVRPKYQTTWFRFKRMAWNWYKVGARYVSASDIRYQWAIENTDKEYLFLMHDDIQFKSDIIGSYLTRIKANSANAIVGDLGQCWRCEFKSEGCSPEKILNGYRPSIAWPSTKIDSASHAWACRVNEWSALLRVNVARDLVATEGVYFGNYDADGDIAAYWFSRVIAAGYRFDDPYPSTAQREEMYAHWENGITGHSAWVDQGVGKTGYDSVAHSQKLLEDFGYRF